MQLKHKIVYGREIPVIREGLEKSLGEGERIVSLDIDFHNHGPWTDYKLGKWNIEHFPRYVGAVVENARSKNLDLFGIVDIQAEGFNEKRFENLLKSGRSKLEHYTLEFDEKTSLAIFNFSDGRKQRMARVQEVLTNIPKIHCLGVGLPIDVNIQGGRTPQDTAKEIKDKGGYSISDHSYFATLKAKSYIQLMRKDLDGLEFNGQLNTSGRLGSGVLALEGLGGILNLLFPGLSLVSETPLPFIAGLGAFGAIHLGLNAYTDFCNYLVLRRAPRLGLPVIGSSDANTAKSMGKTRTRVYMSSKEAEDDANLIKNIFENIHKANYHVLAEKDHLGRLISHVIKGKYSQFRAKMNWFYEVPKGEEKGLPSA